MTSFRRTRPLLVMLLVSGCAEQVDITFSVRELDRTKTCGTGSTTNAKMNSFIVTTYSPPPGRDCASGPIDTIEERCVESRDTDVVAGELDTVLVQAKLRMEDWDTGRRTCIRVVALAETAAAVAREKPCDPTWHARVKADGDTPGGPALLRLCSRTAMPATGTAAIKLDDTACARFTDPGEFGRAKECANLE